MPFEYSCAGCGITVVKHKRFEKARAFCSSDCYHKSARVREDRKCPQCGVAFNPCVGPRSNRQRAGRKFCSMTCFRASQPKVTKACVACGCDFTVKVRLANQRTCSPGCKKSLTVYVDCERCGKTFNNSDPRRLNRHYCSETCRRPPVWFSCKTCGKQVRREPKQRKRQFCSLACYRSYQGETLLEASVRVALESLGIGFEQEFPFQPWSIDFAIPERKLAIEADGDYWHKLTAARDARRDRQLADAGWTVIRLAESEVNATGDLGQFIAGKIGSATGLTLTDLLPSNEWRSVQTPRTRRPAWKRLAHQQNEAQLPLWDDDSI